MSESIVVPEKPMFNGFDSWRKYQREAVEKLVNADKKFDLLDSPTGSGKSIVAMCIAKLMNGRVYYLVGTKDLQEQVIRDFPDVAVLKGRNNFKCLLKDVNCDSCMYSYIKKRCPEKENCPYYRHKEKARQSKHVVWNYPMFLVNQTFAGDFPPADLIVCDEAHLLEGALMNFVNIKFDKEFFNDLGLTFPGKEDEKWVFKRIAEAYKIVNRQYSELAGQLQMSLYEDEEPHVIDIKRCREFEGKLKKMNFFYKVYNKDWVMDYLRDSYDWENSYIMFKPLKVDNFSDYIFAWGSKILLMSATLPNTNILCNSLGISPRDTARLNIPSTFKKENRPIIYKDIGRMSYAYWEITIEKIVRYLSEYCRMNKEKILIHCVNYRIAGIVTSSSGMTHDYSFFYHEGAGDRTVMLDKFKEAEAPAMLVSPSMESGIDLPGDLCRTQFILKIPYLSIADKQVKERMAIDRDWYISSTINRLVQMSGRIIRSEDDWGKTYILDSCFEDLIRYYKKFFPAWFLEAVAVERRST